MIRNFNNRRLTVDDFIGARNMDKKIAGQVFKRYSQMKLQMKREALEKINRQANEMPLDSGTAMVQ
jgi:hypothetical protein